MILAGSLFTVVSAGLPILLFGLGLDTPAALFLPMMLTGVANGVALPGAISGAISVRPEIAGAASGLSGAAQIGAGALLAAIGGAVTAGADSPFPVFAVMLAAGVASALVAWPIYRRHRR
jgi:DHA1 family bicyclomycin/chloramphenicol resistance-like MFS transporter